jgi:CheY-like chemotaxis protein
MPVMNGFELLEKIREEHLAPDASVIVLTNKYEQEFIAKATQAGVEQYIVKASLVPSEVMKEVFRILKRKEEVFEY